MNLFINACVREGSRTKRLAAYLLKKLEGPVAEVRVGELRFPKADQAFLERRDFLEVCSGSAFFGSRRSCRRSSPAYFRWAGGLA